MNLDAGRASLEPTDLRQIYYLKETRRYIRPVADQSWTSEDRPALKVFLKSEGLAGAIEKGSKETVSEVDAAILKIHNEHTLDGVGEIGWLEPGVQWIGNKRILVTGNLKKRVPVAGDWKVVAYILQGLLGTGMPYQIFLGWLKTALIGFYQGFYQYGQVMILVGDMGFGKSLVQDKIISAVLGDNSANPYPWLTKQTSFNAELWKSIHLKVEDEFSSGTKKDRQHLAAMLKRLSVTTQHEFRQKFMPVWSAHTFWRCTISLNKEPHCLRALPELSRDTLDKLIAFWCKPINFIELGPRFDNGINKWEEKIDAAIPAFIDYLLYDHTIHNEIADQRYGVMSYIAPEVMKLADLYSNDTVIFAILKELYMETKVQKTLTKILYDLEGTPYQATVKQYINTNETLAMFLGSMVQKYPQHFKFVGIQRDEGLWDLDFTDGSFTTKQ